MLPLDLNSQSTKYSFPRTASRSDQMRSKSNETKLQKLTREQCYVMLTKMAMQKRIKGSIELTHGSLYSVDVV